MSYVHVSFCLFFTFSYACFEDEFAGAIVAKRACPLLCHDCKHQHNYIFSPSELEFMSCRDLLCFLVSHLLIVTRNRFDTHIHVIPTSIGHVLILYFRIIRHS